MHSVGSEPLDGSHALHLGAVVSLLTTLRRNGAALDETLQTVLRTAYVAEDARSRIYRRIARDVLSVLTSAGIPVIVLKGTALSGTVYPDPVLRHCHDIDLLVTRGDLLQAASACASLKFSPATSGIGSGTEHARLDHTSGLPVELPYYGATFDDVWDRS